MSSVAHRGWQYILQPKVHQDYLESLNRGELVTGEPGFPKSIHPGSKVSLARAAN